MPDFRPTRHTQDPQPRGSVRPAQTQRGMWFATVTLPTTVPGFRISVAGAGSLHNSLQEAYAHAELEAERARTDA